MQTFFLEFIIDDTWITVQSKQKNWLTYLRKTNVSSHALDIMGSDVSSAVIAKNMVWEKVLRHYEADLSNDLRQSYVYFFICRRVFYFPYFSYWHANLSDNAALVVSWVVRCGGYGEEKLHPPCTFYSGNEGIHMVCRKYLSWASPTYSLFFRRGLNATREFYTQ